MKLGILCAAVAATIASAGADPKQWTTASGGNGHYYDYIVGNYTWTDARALALASTFNGQTGYLATVTSAGENTFLGTLRGDGWLGGTDQQNEGDWRWADGPEAGQLFWQGGPNGTAIGYASWNNGEPNNQNDEDYLQRNGGAWNDVSATSMRGYFVEYGGTAAVPEAATWAMMIAGFGLVGGAMRRRKVAVRFA